MTDSLPAQTTKTCAACGETHPVDQFGPDGARRHCLPCRRAWKRAWAAKNPDKVKENWEKWYAENGDAVRERRRNDPRSAESGRAWRQSERGRATTCAVAKKQRQLYPERAAARAIVRNAINAGFIARLPCQVCGATEADAHHPDYDKPLTLVWLCHRHHTDVHNDAITCPPSTDYVITDEMRAEKRRWIAKRAAAGRWGSRAA